MPNPNILPALFLIIIFAGSYYVYFYHYILFVLKNGYNKILLIFGFNLITVMFLWSFFATMSSTVGRVPLEYKLDMNQHRALLNASTDDEKEEILENVCEANNLLLYTCTITGGIRYCVTCMHIKPDRAHHCSACQLCFLRMDHHCPWANNCIGFMNYKSFVLLIVYSFLYCFYIVVTVFHYVIEIADKANYGRDLPIFLLFILAIIMAMVIFVFLCYHIILLKNNETTLENIYKPNFVEDDLTFDLGWCQNLRDVFGEKWYLWCVPVFSSMGSGHVFLVARK